MHTKILLLLTLLCSAASAQTISVSGYVKEKGSGESLPGVSVYLENSTIGTTSNSYGFYSLEIPINQKINLIFSFVGYQKETKELSGTENTALNIELDLGNELAEVVVNATEQDERVSDQVNMSKISIPISQVKKLPAFLGEKDVLKVLQLMPGVQKGTEGQAGIYVRGGGPDQNLLILDDATVYNANHLFGFFSVFNGDALKSVELTKGGFPAQYGGRLSSVIDMQMKDGNKEKFSGEGGIGLISSRLTLEGPIGKEKKASFLISGRRTYLDILAKPFIKMAIKRDSNGEGEGTAGYFFHDLNAKINYDFGRKDKLYLSGFFGADKFKIVDKQKEYSDQAGIKWGNKTGTLRWNHLYNTKLFSNTSLIFSSFNFGINNISKEFDEDGTETSDYTLNYDSGIKDIAIKTDFDYFLNAKHAIKFGVQAIHHTFNPTAYVVSGSEVDEPINIKPNTLKSIESGLYLQDVWTVNNKFKVNYGLRFSNFDTGEKNYGRLEPRLSATYKLGKDLSVKGSYAVMNQYIHLLSNTGIGLPTDLWVPTTDKVAPQKSNQVALGLAKDFSESGYSLTLEGYYKKMGNIISYKEGSSFLQLDGSSEDYKNWEDNITAGKGWSYGAEILLQKKTGRFSGWAGYTLSWTQWQFDELNFGKKFYPKYDRRHDISLVGIYEVNKRITLSGTWVYGTGNALTIPVATYQVPSNYEPFESDSQNSNTFYGRPSEEYGGRNSFRAEAYHRLDLGIQFHKLKKNHERTWEFSIFNAYNRKNPFFYQSGIDYESGTNKAVLRRVSLIPIVPSFSYNFKF